MGEVWRVKDTKLGREGAIMMLPRAGLRPRVRLQNAPTVTFSPQL